MQIEVVVDVGDEGLGVERLDEFFFFFQAEDGIRDYKVTGVQTCALPILSQSPSSQPIRFYHRGQIVEVQGPHPTRSVLDWLRGDARCTGTKEGCNEGDCGACTVVIAELAEDGAPDAVGGLQLQTVNACIQDRKSVV